MRNEQTLYQKVIGNDLMHLPPVLRDFHSRAHGGEARGWVRVRHGHGILRRFLARALHLPPVGERVAVTLCVNTTDNCEIWIRNFDGQRVETMQWQEGKYLIEKAGPLRFVFCLEANIDELQFIFQHNKIGNIKLPVALLRVNATARGCNEKWHIEVTISAPLLGMLAEYSGEITPC